MSGTCGISRRNPVGVGVLYRSQRPQGCANPGLRDTTPSGLVRWGEAVTGSNRVIRGGLFYGRARYVRSAIRYYPSPVYRPYCFGFRLLRRAQ